jgi:hypothetical protein
MVQLVASAVQIERQPWADCTVLRLVRHTQGAAPRAGIWQAVLRFLRALGEHAHDGLTHHWRLVLPWRQADVQGAAYS